MKNETITLLIPRSGRDYIEGCLNGSNFRIRAGEPVEVPKHLAAIILDSQKAVAVGKSAVAAYCGSGGKRIL